MGGPRGLRRGKQLSREDSGCPTPRLRFRLLWLGKFPFRMGPAPLGAPLIRNFIGEGIIQEPAIDRAVTVRERDLITDRIPIDLIARTPLGPQTRFPSLQCRIPLPHGHGSVRSASDIHGGGNQSFFLEWSQHR